MIERKNIIILIGFVLSVSLLSSSLTALSCSEYYHHAYLRTLGQICQGIADNLEDAQAEQAVLTALKEYVQHPEAAEEDNLLLSYGYRQQDFLKPARSYGGLFILAGFMTGGLLFLGTFLFLDRRETDRIRALTDYLEKVNTGNSGVLLQAGEDEFSRLQDEIYKTVTALHQTRDAAVRDKNNFAENLYNIAHQIKTPVTSISLSVQMMPQDSRSEQIGRQVARLIHLEEALLLLSRIDAGTLALERKETDVFTLLVLAAENLQELFREAGITVRIPEAGEMIMHADMEWTMEAVMNLLKNCMEHTPPGGCVCCSCERNPLYVQIRIWDTGPGFAREDLPHLFERFYRGKNAGGGGIGIGLALSRAIIERQNGTVSARNLPEGGACFEIRFYCH